MKSKIIMKSKVLLCAAAAVAFGLLATSDLMAQKKWDGVWTDPQAKDLPADFKIQGEYVGTADGKKLGAQVIALSDGKFQAVLYPGGLPGDGWDGKNKILMDGATEDGKTSFAPAEGKKRYLGNSAAEFSATSQFPPEGQKPYSGQCDGETLTGKTDGGKEFSLKRIQRVSPTMGQKAPKGAIVLFDGSNTEEWNSGRLDKATKLLNTDGGDILTKRKFNNYHVHVEFMMPYRPSARGQGRGNSGFYQVDHYEVQILDSFGLDGKNNECGGVYSKAAALVNGCLPPLSWQTYDIEFTNAVAEDGKRVKKAVLTAKLNGIVVQNKLEIDGKTGGSRSEAEGTPGVLKLQGHGNPLQFRNIWIIEK
jgi:hypothetical protein